MEILTAATLKYKFDMINIGLGPLLRINGVALNIGYQISKRHEAKLELNIYVHTFVLSFSCDGLK